MPNLAIIPARGGSKRIPKKNIKQFLGKPIIAYSIEAALTCGLFDTVMVSTDDIEISDISIKYGADVPFIRSAETSNDFATTFEVINEVVSNFEANNQKFEYICCIYPCAPFVTAIKLIKSFDVLKNNQFDSVFPIMPFSFPIQRAIKHKNNRLNYFFPEFSLSRSQDLEKSYHDAGQFYWLKTDVCLYKKQILTENSGGFIIDEIEGQDIDNEADWHLAEMKYRFLNG